MTELHAHVSIQSRDCDGLYDRSFVLHSEVDGIVEPADEFKSAIAGLYLPSDSKGWQENHDWGFEWSEPTDEGFSAGELRWCTDDDADEPNTFRDHTAESMGY